MIYNNLLFETKLKNPGNMCEGLIWPDAQQLINPIICSDGDDLVQTVSLIVRSSTRYKSFDSGSECVVKTMS